MMKKKIILLNGPSSSGKSTLAGTLQKMLKDMNNESYGIISIDDFLKMSTDEVIYEDDVFEISPQLCNEVIQTLTSWQGVIIDHVITSERIFDHLIKNLRPNDLYLIHVTCPLSELVKREKQRNNRRLGSAKASFQYLFPKDGYDLTVDTYRASAQECSQQIMSILAEFRKNN